MEHSEFICQLSELAHNCPIAHAHLCLYYRDGKIDAMALAIDALKAKADAVKYAVAATSRSVAPPMLVSVNEYETYIKSWR